MPAKLKLTPSRTVLIGLVLFCAYFCISNWFRQVNLVTSQFDMGNMDQTLWHTLHGRVFQMTDPAHPTLMSRASVHTDFLLLIYTPFYALWQDPRIVLVLQVLFVASGALPLFWYARSRVGDRPAAILSIGYLCYPPQLWGIVFDVHAVVLVAPLLLWAWWALHERRWWVYALTASLAVLGKEEIGLLVAAVGLYWGFRRGYRLVGLSSAILGIAISMIMVGWVIPNARQSPGHFAIGYYEAFGNTTAGVVRGVITQPLDVLKDMFGSDALWLHRALLVPVAGLALLGWPVLLLALPEYGINLLSSNPNQHTIYFQYMSGIIPFIFLATVEGWARLLRVSERSRFSSLARWWKRYGIATVIVTVTGSVWIWAPLPGTRHHRDAVRPFQVSPYRSAIQRVQQELAPVDRVVATNNLVPQFSRREFIWAFPNNLDQADAILVLEGGDYDIVPAAQIHEAVARLAADPKYVTVLHEDSFWYFRPVQSSS